MRAISIFYFGLFFISCQTNKVETTHNCCIESKDSLIFNSFVEFSQHCSQNNISDIAYFFLNTPYKGGTLDINLNEKTVINLRELDCLTFVENVLALYMCNNDKNLNLNSFISTIKEIRYRGDTIYGYESRLHYSTDWLYSNSKKGFITDITQSIGGQTFNKNISFMSNNANKYPALNSEHTIRKIKDIEANINNRQYFYIPKHKVQKIEEQIQNGDIIMITSSTEGLDIAHLGYAINIDHRIYLFHASSEYGKVIISPSPLVDYLSKVNKFTGIMVLRIN